MRIAKTRGQTTFIAWEDKHDRNDVSIRYAGVVTVTQSVFFERFPRPFDIAIGDYVRVRPSSDGTKIAPRGEGGGRGRGWQDTAKTPAAGPYRRAPRPEPSYPFGRPAGRRIDPRGKEPPPSPPPPEYRDPRSYNARSVLV